MELSGAGSRAGRSYVQDFLSREQLMQIGLRSSHLTFLDRHVKHPVFTRLNRLSLRPWRAIRLHWRGGRVDGLITDRTAWRVFHVSYSGILIKGSAKEGQDQPAPALTPRTPRCGGIRGKFPAIASRKASVTFLDHSYRVDH